MVVKEVYAKTILSRSKVSDYTINPYIGCEHNCTYCYARFMRRFTGHKEAWGSFVDVKINAASLLQHEIQRKRIGRVWMSGVCDPYQPLEKKYEMTKKCLKILSNHNWPVTIQTKSPLVLRDIGLLRGMEEVEAGFTITTTDDRIRRIFEPNCPPIHERIEALRKLHSAGIKTYAMIAPLLPNAEELPARLGGKADYVLIDRMNYHHADWVYRKHKLQYAMTTNFFAEKGRELVSSCRRKQIPCQILF
ncbi:MAG: radical SAM protein [Candidatus Bathyarchaeota archaeon]|nr:MAG: radical SAM protein [Candidatus Bathyarchaeota archaeon]